MKVLIYLLPFLFSVTAFSQQQVFMLIKNSTPTEASAARFFTDTYTISSGGATAQGLTLLPEGYTEDVNTRYPVIFFMHGSGEASATYDSAKLASTGLPQLIRDGFRPSAYSSADGQTHKFIVISRQRTSGSVTPIFSEIKALYGNVLARYRVDSSMVYFMGLSIGANGSIIAATGEPAFAKKIAAIVPQNFAGGLTLSVIDSIPKMGGERGVKMWNITGSTDTWLADTRDITNRYNSVSPPDTAILSVIQGVGHEYGSWNLSASTAWKTHADNQLDLDVYEWMLQYKRLPADYRDNIPSLPTGSTLQLNFAGNLTSSPTGWEHIGATNTQVQTAGGYIKTGLKLSDNTLTSFAVTNQTTFLATMSSQTAATDGNGVFANSVIGYSWKFANGNQVKISGADVNKTYTVYLLSNAKSYEAATVSFTVNGQTTAQKNNSANIGDHVTYPDWKTDPALLKLTGVAPNGSGEIIITGNVITGSFGQLNAVVLVQE